MHWIQAIKGFLNSHQIRLTELATNIHISCDESHSVGNRGKSTHEEKFDLSGNESTH